MDVLSFIQEYVPNPEQINLNRAIRYYQKAGYPTHSMWEFYWHRVSFYSYRGVVQHGLGHSTDSKSGRLAIKAEAVFVEKYSEEINNHMQSKVLAVRNFFKGKSKVWPFYSLMSELGINNYTELHHAISENHSALKITLKLQNMNLDGIKEVLEYFFMADSKITHHVGRMQKIGIENGFQLLRAAFPDFKKRLFSIGSDEELMCEEILAASKSILKKTDNIGATPERELVKYIPDFFKGYTVVPLSEMMINDYEITTLAELVSALEILSDEIKSAASEFRNRDKTEFEKFYYDI